MRKKNKLHTNKLVSALNIKKTKKTKAWQKRKNNKEI